jgi:hypothetical protein
MISSWWVFNYPPIDPDADAWQKGVGSELRVRQVGDSRRRTQANTLCTCVFSSPRAFPQTQRNRSTASHGIIRVRSIGKSCPLSITRAGYI